MASPKLIEKGAFCAVVLLYLLQFVLGQSVCPSGSAPTWSQWACNTSTNVLTRSGICNDSNMTAVIDKMDGAPVITWSGWSPWLPTCGSNVTIQERHRTCTVPESPHYCSSCGTQNVTQESSRNATSLVPCCEEFSWLPWTTWSPEPSCCNGDRVEQTRRRGRIPCEGVNCPKCPEEMDNRTALIQDWGNWGIWSGFLQSCSEATYRNRSRVCGQPTNPDNLDILRLCLPNMTDVEYGCCQTTYMWVPLDNTSRTCEQQYCLEVCAKTATPLPEGVSVMKLTDEQLVCMLCEPGTQRNVTGQEPTPKPTTFPFVSTYWWVVLIIVVATGVAVVLIIAAFVLCYKSYQKYRHTYYLKLKRKTMQGVYGNVILGQTGKQLDTVEQRKLLSTYWSNPLHVGKEDSQEDMTAEDLDNPFRLVQENKSTFTGSLDEEDNLILANPVFGMKSALPLGAREEGTTEHRDHPFRYVEVETRGVPSSVSQADSGAESSDAHFQSLEIGNQSGTHAYSNAVWERFDNSSSDDIGGEKQDETTVDTLHEDLPSITASVDGEEGSEDEEQGAATVCHEDEEAVQGIQLQARARGESPECSQELELVEYKPKTFEGEFTWEAL